MRTFRTYILITLSLMATAMVSLTVSAQEFMSGPLRFAVTAPGEVAVVSNYVDGENDYCGVVIIPEQVHYDGATHHVTAIADDAFAGSQVTAVQVPSSVTAIGIGAFADAAQLADITLPLHLTTISPYLLAGTAVTDVVVPEGVTAIGEGAFEDCTQLHTLMLPSTLVAIDSHCFEGCYNLYELYCPAALPPAIADATAFDDLRNVDVMVADDGIAHRYAQAPQWNDSKQFVLWTIDEPWTTALTQVELLPDEHYNDIVTAGNHLAYEIYDDWGDLIAVTAAAHYYAPSPRREVNYTVVPTNMIRPATEASELVTLLPAAITEPVHEELTEPQVVVHDGAIHIKGDNHGSWIHIYDAYGMLYYQRPALEGIIDGLPRNRVYIVIVGNHATKVAL